MSNFGDRSWGSYIRDAADGESGQPAPGKRTLVQARYAVQRKAGAKAAAGEHQAAAPSASADEASADPFDFTFPVQRKATASPEDPAVVQAAAARGTSGGGSTLPYLDSIQRSFGRHDVGEVRAHTGAAAAEANAAMGAEAYATGNDIAFAGAPSLHTAAHEAAHVVQQRAGVHLKGGVGEEGDPYERHADAVADAVVAGRSAEPLLDQFGGGGGARGAVERKVASGVVQRAMLPKLAAEPAYHDGLTLATILATAVTKYPPPSKTKGKWGNGAKARFKEVCGVKDPALFEGLLADPRFLQNGDVRGGEVMAPAPAQLPAGVTYKEYDIRKYAVGVDRGEVRVVVGSDGKRYYSANHYVDFAPF